MEAGGGGLKAPRRRLEQQRKAEPGRLAARGSSMPMVHLRPLSPVPQLSTQTPGHVDTPSAYCEAKLGARTYQATKRQLFRAFQKAGLGTWVRKPPEQDQFPLAL